MGFQRRAIYAAALIFTCETSAAYSKDRSFEWKSLTDDYSRAMLFQENIEGKAPQPTRAEASKALNGRFEFPQNAVNDGGHPRIDAIFGVDISHWSTSDPKCERPLNPQNEIDFSTFAGQHIRFVYVKASQDVDYKDCRFAEYWRQLGKLHSENAPLRGGYHFLSAGSAGLDQAKSYVRLRRETGGFDRDELPSVLDLEWDKSKTNSDRWDSKTPTEIVQNALDWLQYVEAQSEKKPIVYTSDQWIKDRHIPNDILSKLKPYRLWIADYSQTRRAIERPSLPSGFANTLWQFTATSKLSRGSPKLLDASIFKGTEYNFYNYMQIKAK